MIICHSCLVDTTQSDFFTPSPEFANVFLVRKVSLAALLLTGSRTEIIAKYHADHL